MAKFGRFNGKKILRGAGYFFFFLLMTLLFTYLTLPFEKIKARYVKVVEDKYNVDIVGKIEKSWFTGLAIKSLRITPRAKPGEKVQETEIEEGSVRLSLLPLFLGRLQGTLSLKLVGGGSLSATVTRKGGKVDVEAKLDALDIKSLPILKSMLGGRNIEGVVSGSINATLGKNPVDWAGKLELSAENVKMNEFKVPIAQLGNQSITVPALSMGNLKAEVELVDGAAVVKTLKFEGPSDVQASLEGYLQLREPFGTSELNAYMRFKLSEDFFKRNPKFTILQGEASMKSALRPDGFYGFSLQGVVGQLQHMRRVPSPNPPSNLTPPKGGALQPGGPQPGMMPPGMPPGAMPPRGPMPPRPGGPPPLRKGPGGAPAFDEVNKRLGK